MNDCIEVLGGPGPVLLDGGELGLVGVLEDAVAGDVIALLCHVLFDAAEDIAVGEAGRLLQERDELFDGKVAVRAAVTLARAGRVLG